MKNKVLIVAFSGRKQGNCEQIADYIARNLAVSVTIYRMSEHTIHNCSNCNYECFTRGERCPYLADDEVLLLDGINQSDVVYFIVPNYCDHPPAMFYSFNERSLCYFSRKQHLLEQYMAVKKRFIVVSNSRPDSFRLAFEQHINDPEILWLSAKEFGLRSINGDLMESKEVQDIIRAFIEKT